MFKLIVALYCSRQEGKMVYDGRIEVSSPAGQLPLQQLNVLFEGRPLEEAGVRLHHILRFLTAPDIELCVQIYKGASKQSRMVPINLNISEVQSLYESVESARRFFSPICYVRQEK